MKNYPNIMTKKAVLEVISTLYNELDNITTNTTKEYKKIGVDETKQRTHWRTGELIWEDEEQTIPSYEPIYDYVDKTDDEMTDEDIAMLDAIADRPPGHCRSNSPTLIADTYYQPLHSPRRLYQSQSWCRHQNSAPRRRYPY